MKLSTVPIVFSLIIATRPALGSLPSEARQDDDDESSNDQEDYINSVCSPEVSPDADSLPPCITIQNIEGQCAPNGTSPLALDAHAQCLCGGSYFAQWKGCQRCLFVHGARSDRDAAYYASVMTSASEMLCTGAPSAPWQDLFTGAQAAVAFPTTGATRTSDQTPSDTAASLYYTASGSEGPGKKITGSATAATATPTTASGTSGRTTTAKSTGSDDEEPPATTDVDTPESTSSPDSAAVPTGINGGQGGWFPLLALY